MQKLKNYTYIFKERDTCFLSLPILNKIPK